MARKRRRFTAELKIRDRWTRDRWTVLSCVARRHYLRRMSRPHHASRIRRAAAAALSLQFAAVFGLSVIEASHNHLEPHTVQWHGQTGDHPGDDQSAHVQCILCGHGGMSMAVANRAVVVHAPAVRVVRAHLPASSRLAAVDAGFSTQPRAPPVT